MLMLWWRKGMHGSFTPRRGRRSVQDDWLQSEHLLPNATEHLCNHHAWLTARLATAELDQELGTFHEKRQRGDRSGYGVLGRAADTLVSQRGVPR
jgi:hypothetical protein